MDRTRHVDGASMDVAVDRITRNNNWNHLQGGPLNTSNGYCSRYHRVEKCATVQFCQGAVAGERDVRKTSSPPRVPMDRTRS